MIIFKTPLFLLATLALVSCSKEYENEEDPTPPSETVTYQKHIKPILDNNCIGCHGGTSPVANLRLETFSQAKATANGGKLLNSVKGIQGASIMPPSGKMKQENIQLIEFWIDQGLKESVQ